MGKPKLSFLTRTDVLGGFQFWDPTNVGPDQQATDSGFTADVQPTGYQVAEQSNFFLFSGSDASIYTGGSADPSLAPPATPRSLMPWPLSAGRGLRKPPSGPNGRPQPA